MSIDDDISALTEAIRRHPDDEELYVLRARAWYDQYEKEKAMTDLNRAIELSPFRSEALSLRAALHVGNGAYDDCIEDCNAALQIDPNDASAYCSRASAWLAKDEYARAISDFDRALSLEPNPGAFYWRGVAKEYSGDLEGAKLDFEMCEALKPAYSECDSASDDLTSGETTIDLDAVLAKELGCVFRIMTKEKRHAKWIEALGNIGNLGRAMAHAKTLSAYEVGVFLDGAIYWTSRWPDVFNSTVIKLRRSSN